VWASFFLKNRYYSGSKQCAREGEVCDVAWGCCYVFSELVEISSVTQEIVFFIDFMIFNDCRNSCGMVYFEDASHVSSEDHSMTTLVQQKVVNI